jgi:hypothetical protein
MVQGIECIPRKIFPDFNTRFRAAVGVFPRALFNHTEKNAWRSGNHHAKQKTLRDCHCATESSGSIAYQRQESVAQKADPTRGEHQSDEEENLRSNPAVNLGSASCEHDTMIPTTKPALLTAVARSQCVARHILHFKAVVCAY